MHKWNKTAQSIVEYVVLIAIVVMAVGGMKMYMLRSVKAQFKVMQDRLTGSDDSVKNITVSGNLTGD